MSLTRLQPATTGRLLALITVAALALSGCTGDTDEPSPTGATEPSQATTATPSPTTATTTAPALADLTVAPGAIGPAQAGMTKDAAMATGLFNADVEVGGEECGRTEPLGWKSEFASSLDVLTSKKGIIVSLGVRDDQPRTAEGLGVGSTLRQVSRVYRDAELTEAGYNQAAVFVNENGRWLAFLFGNDDIDSINPKSTVTLVEVTSGTKPDVMRDGC